MKIGIVKQQRTPVRAALADAIDAHEKAIRDACAAEAALTSCNRLIAEAEQDLGAARYRAEEDHRIAIMRAIHDGGTMEAVRTDAPAIDTTNLERRLAACVAARPVCQTGVDDAAYTLEKASQALEKAVKDVEREAVAALLQEAQVLEADLFQRRQVLVRLAVDFPTIRFYGGDLGSPLHATSEALALRSFLSRPTLPSLDLSLRGIIGLNDQVVSAEAPWLAAREALMRDPDAPLPKGGQV